jgi:hypothetical protein
MPPPLSILLIDPSTDGSPENRLKSYLTLGSLASAVRETVLLDRIAARLGLPVPGEPPRVTVAQLCDRSGRSLLEFLRTGSERAGGTIDIVGLTATSAGLELAAEAARTAGRLFPRALRVIGGPHVSVAPEETLLRVPCELACVGEGVETLVELVVRLSAGNPDFSQVEGVAWRETGGRIRVNPARRELLPLDDYPPPSDSLHLFWPHLNNPAQNARYPVGVLAGYGCPHDCSFCAQRCIHGGRVRERSAESLFAEAQRLHRRGFHKFAFVQETFLNRTGRVERFCNLVQTAGLRLEWTVEARADQVSRERLARMRAAGLTFIQLGVETGDADLLRSLGKCVGREQVVQAIEWCRELGIHTAVYLLVGLPGQGWQSILRTALLIHDHTPYNRLTRHASVSIAIPYPGTRIRRDSSVRLVDWDCRDFPARNPEVTVAADGGFEGRAHTETDDMSAAEIFEAWLFLDDFCHFLMDARQGDPARPEARAQSLAYAEHLLHMIARRTLRDLVARSGPDARPAERLRAMAAMDSLDGGAERRLKDVAASPEVLSRTWLDFLAAARFEGGGGVMGRMQLRTRLKWVKLCAIAWAASGGICRGIAMSLTPAEGERLKVHVTGIAAEELDRRLAAADAGQTVSENRVRRTAAGDVEAYNVRFRPDMASSRLLVLPRGGEPQGE